MSIEQIAVLSDENSALKKQIEFYQGDFLVMEEAARFLKVSRSTMEKISASRLVDVYKPAGGKVYFLKMDLVSYLMNGQRKSVNNVAAGALKRMGGTV